MILMQNLPPTEYQLVQARIFLEVVGNELNPDDFYEALQNDVALELWDNIAAEEYERQGGEFEDDDPNEPTDPKLYEDCWRWATDLIIELSR